MTIYLEVRVVEVNLVLELLSISMSRRRDAGMRRPLHAIDNNVYWRKPSTSWPKRASLLDLWVGGWD